MKSGGSWIALSGLMLMWWGCGAEEVLHDGPLLYECANDDCTAYQKKTCKGAECQSIGQSCVDDLDCTSGVCYGEGICQAGTNGNPCLTPSDCAAGHFCVQTTSSSYDKNKACSDGQGLSGSFCGSDTVCKSNICYKKKCQTGTNFSLCGKDEDCATGYVCLYTGSYSDKKCSNSTIGGPCLSSCLKGACVENVCAQYGDELCLGELCLGTLCKSNEDCGQGELCAFLGSVGVCTTGENGDTCGDDTHCGSGLNCIDGAYRWSGASAASVCTDGAVGSLCNSTSDCSKGVCVGEPQSGSHFLGVCTVPGAGTKCVMTFPSNCSPNRAHLGITDCANKMVCIPDGSCEKLSGANPVCVGKCGSSGPGGYCLGFDGCKNGWTFDHSQYQSQTTYGCGYRSGLYCYKGLCTKGAQGDPCGEEACDSGLKCFNGTCVKK